MQLKSELLLYLDKLKDKPPSSFIIEGGLSESRFEFFKFMAKKINCLQGGCTNCSFCLNIEKKEAIDTFIFSGQEVNIENIRDLKSQLANKPKLSYRLICFEEAQDLNVNCLNSLLKVIEETPPQNIFFFLLPQRESTLQTIISRSFILNISFFKSEININMPLEKIKEFIDKGNTFLNLKKNNYNKKDIRNLINYFQKELVNFILKKESIFQNLNEKQFFKITNILNIAQKYLSYNCDSQLVLEWMLIKIFITLKKSNF
ncbi:MAG: DNA polymerase III, delta prime subunit, putative [Desulfonauticus sp. 38_4375]|nr:MAG: DNA polymerase III, delta prime subunit, putative [Desulfonauticus sp. 38_4375]